MEALAAVVTVRHPVGLHARPAAQFVQTARQFSSQIQVEALDSGGRVADAKSILMVLTLGVEQNHKIRITASGEDQAEAIASLVELVESNFGEQED